MTKAITFLAIILLIFPAAFGANINVGGGSGWSSGFDYDTWAKGQTFTTTDVLVFTYAPTHSVDEVSQADYQNCNSDNTIASNSSSPTSIPLTAAGTRYFICPTSDHCSRGMKLAVTVTDGSGTGTPSPPSLPPPPPPSGATVVLAGWDSLFLGVLAAVATLFGVIG